MYPVKKIKMPADLKGVENGKLSKKLLKVAGKATMHHVASRAWVAMQATAKKDGVVLGNVGSYRPYAQQEALFLQRYDDKPTGRRPKVTRVWQGKTWYLRKGMAPAGTPGTSNHGWGLAIDVGSVEHDGRLQWLVKNAGRFGFSWAVADPKDPNFEAWHLQLFSGAPTKAVLDWEAANGR